ncbi:hypothetical protein O6H91_07G035300 [Diphasiastrum complanatum]|uniref:Uncharacterized protein n=1 Tax=Diphasiastrum complanatum TaxID=34168 RepID=A0ACC2D3Z7_DIPCM|nr:hypothetical protein O6H91_07G035300 [Diphasiastrum complanatum]
MPCGTDKHIKPPHCTKRCLIPVLCVHAAIAKSPLESKFLSLNSTCSLKEKLWSDLRNTLIHHLRHWKFKFARGDMKIGIMRNDFEIFYQKRNYCCPHPCSQVCHPGSCPPCKSTVKRACHCGALVNVFECNSSLLMSTT